MTSAYLLLFFLGLLVAGAALYVGFDQRRWRHCGILAGLAALFIVTAALGTLSRPLPDETILARRALESPLTRTLQQAQVRYQKTGAYPLLPAATKTGPVTVVVHTDRDTRGIMVSAFDSNHDRMTAVARNGVVVQRTCLGSLHGCTRERWAPPGGDPVRNNSPLTPAARPDPNARGTLMRGPLTGVQ